MVPKSPEIRHHAPPDIEHHTPPSTVIGLSTSRPGFHDIIRQAEHKHSTGTTTVPANAHLNAGEMIPLARPLRPCTRPHCSPTLSMTTQCFARISSDTLSLLSSPLTLPTMVPSASTAPQNHRSPKLCRSQMKQNPCTIVAQAHLDMHLGMEALDFGGWRGYQRPCQGWLASGEASHGLEHAGVLHAQE